MSRFHEIVVGGEDENRGSGFQAEPPPPPLCFSPLAPTFGSLSMKYRFCHLKPGKLFLFMVASPALRVMGFAGETRCRFIAEPRQESSPVLLSLWKPYFYD